MEIEMRSRFSYGLESSLTAAERKANLKILDMRDKVALEGIHNLCIHNFFQAKGDVENS